MLCKPQVVQDAVKFKPTKVQIDDFLNFIKSKDEFKNKIDVDQNGE